MSDVLQRRRTVALTIGAVVAIAAIVAAVLLIVLRDGTSEPRVGSRTLVLPADLSGYRRMQTDEATFRRSVRRYLAPVAGAGDFLRHGVVGQYRRDDAYASVVGVALRDAPELARRVGRSGLDATLPEFVTRGAGGLGTSGPSTAAPAGGLGGAMRCVRVATKVVVSFACAWGDDSVFGLVLYIGGPTSEGGAAAQTRALRPLVERG